MLWRFGPPINQAKVRGSSERRAILPALVGSCKLHGGTSTGPKTEDGLMRLIESKTKH